MQEELFCPSLVLSIVYALFRNYIYVWLYTTHAWVWQHLFFYPSFHIIGVVYGFVRRYVRLSRGLGRGPFHAITLTFA